MFCCQCGKKLYVNYKYEVCVDCAADNILKIFKQYPEVGESFLNTIEKVQEEIKNEQI